MILNVPNFTITETSVSNRDLAEVAGKDSREKFLEKSDVAIRTDFDIKFEGYIENTSMVQSCNSMSNIKNIICSNNCNYKDCKMSLSKKAVSKRKSRLPKRRMKIQSEEELVEREVKEYLLKIPTWERIIPNSDSNCYSYVQTPINASQDDDKNLCKNSLIIEEPKNLDLNKQDQSFEKSLESNIFDEDIKPNINSSDETQLEVHPTDIARTNNEKPKIKTQKPKERVFCSVCGKSFGRPSDLRRHAVLHTGEKKHRCEDCDKVFSQRYHLVRHIKNVHKKDMKNLVCGLCNETFNSEYLLTRHVKGHGVMTFVCEICSKEFKTKRQMKEHILCAHVGMKPFKCDQCDKAFTRKYHLERHMEMHAGTKNFQCEYCGKDFGTKGNLIAHVKRIHLQIKEYTCGVCQKGFYSSKDLQTHIKVHTGEKPFQCDICLRKFSEKSNMEWHLRIHSGDRPYQCDQCNKSYTRLPHLQRHKKEGLCFRRRTKHHDKQDDENDSYSDSPVMQDTDSEAE